MLVLALFLLHRMASSYAAPELLDLSSSLDWSHVALSPRRTHTALALSEKPRELRIPKQLITRFSDLLRKHQQFSFSFSIKQKRNSVAAIFSLTHQNERVLRVALSSRASRLRLSYRHFGRAHTETFPVPRLPGAVESDDSDIWRHVALIVRQRHVSLYVDCELAAERSVAELDWRVPEGSRGWIGQDGNATYLEGALDEVQIDFSEDAIGRICPLVKEACPSCLQFLSVEQTIHNLAKTVNLLNKKLSELSAQVEELRSCECRRECTDGRRVFSDGERWQKHDNCATCKCLNGRISCETLHCPPPACPSPLRIVGKCCPVCPGSCYFHGREFQHGEPHSPRKCTECQCDNGQMRCRVVDESTCPRLSCPPEARVALAEKCCRVCAGSDFCASTTCPANSECLNLSTRARCVCKSGYREEHIGTSGTLATCVDVDECSLIGGRQGHHCGRHALCRNTAGSYSCTCARGFQLVNAYDCEDIDECRDNPGRCSEHAECHNHVGRFTCRCRSGYRGDGIVCRPDCPHKCLNGARCVAPGVCQCAHGFTGKYCKQDLDECTSGIASCHVNSVCTNEPGSFSCKCRAGFVQSSVTGHFGAGCVDVDECADGSICEVGYSCENLAGGFACSCRTAGCKQVCRLNKKKHEDGERWLESRARCECRAGRVTCQQLLESELAAVENESAIGFRRNEPSDAGSVRRHCYEATRGRRYDGEEWLKGCRRCECSLGQIDCWNAPCPVLRCRQQELLDGSCCPRCIQSDVCHARVRRNCSADGVCPTETGHPNQSMECSYDGRVRAGGTMWASSEDNCTTCTCLFGHVCCRYDQNCESGEMKIDKERVMDP